MTPIIIGLSLTLVICVLVIFILGAALKQTFEKLERTEYYLDNARDELNNVLRSSH